MNLGVKLVGNHLDLAEGSTHLQLKIDDSLWGEAIYGTEDLISWNFIDSMSTRTDGYWAEYQYSNDDGETWSDVLRVELKHGYSVTVNESVNGTVTADKTLVAPSDTVSLTVTPDEGYELETLTVMNGETEIAVTDNKFEMPEGAVTVTATFKEANIHFVL